MTPREAVQKLSEACGNVQSITMPNLPPFITNALRRAIPRLQREHRVQIRIGDGGVFEVQPATTGAARGAPKGELRLALEALEPGQTATFDTLTHTLSNVTQTISNVQHAMGMRFSRRFDAESRTVSVMRIDGTDSRGFERQHRGREPKYPFASMELGQVLFITGEDMDAVRQASAYHCKNHGHRHRISESQYDDAIEVQRIHDNGMADNAMHEALAKARVVRVLESEGFLNPGGSTDGSTHWFHGAELFAGQLEDVLRILPPGQTVKISGVPKGKMIERAEFWRQRRGLRKVVIDGISVRFE